jgi:hypothetical protein
VAGTEDDALYRTERWFVPVQGLRPGYHIPLPPGTYRAVLHFAEISYREPGHRRFDVLLEGKKVLEGFEPEVDRAQAFPFELKVEDGHLDLEFGHRLDHPTISAIAVEGLPAPR